MKALYLRDAGLIAQVSKGQITSALVYKAFRIERGQPLTFKRHGANFLEATCTASKPIEIRSRTRDILVGEIQRRVLEGEVEAIALELGFSSPLALFRAYPSGFKGRIVSWQNAEILV